MQRVLPEGVSSADSLLGTRKLLEGQLIINHEIYALRGVVKLANAKNAACVWKQWKPRSAQSTEASLRLPGVVADSTSPSRLLHCQQ